jgi:hypothetical protein
LASAPWVWEKTIFEFQIEVEMEIKGRVGSWRLVSLALSVSAPKGAILRSLVGAARERTWEELK